MRMLSWLWLKFAWKFCKISYKQQKLKANSHFGTYDVLLTAYLVLWMELRMKFRWLVGCLDVGKTIQFVILIRTVIPCWSHLSTIQCHSVVCGIITVDAYAVDENGWMESHDTWDKQQYIRVVDTVNRNVRLYTWIHAVVFSRFLMAFFLLYLDMKLRSNNNSISILCHAY